MKSKYGKFLEDGVSLIALSVSKCPCLLREEIIGTLRYMYARFDMPGSEVFCPRGRVYHHSMVVVAQLLWDR